MSKQGQLSQIWCYILCLNILKYGKTKSILTKNIFVLRVFLYPTVYAALAIPYSVMLKAADT